MRIYLSFKRNRSYMNCPSMQAKKMLGLFFQSATHFFPAEVCAYISNSETVTNQESIELKSIIKRFCHFCYDIFCFCDLGLFDFSQFIVIQDNNTYCRLKLFFDQLEQLVYFCLHRSKITC